MGKVLYMRKGETHTVPIGSLLLSNIAEGSIVKLNENGSPVEFYVAKHDYESVLNGSGRTLLVRRYLVDTLIRFGSTNAYAGSALDVFLNGEYKKRLDTDVQSAISSTEFYYTPGNGNYTVSTLSRSVFPLSLAELRLSHANANTEGSGLPISLNAATISSGTPYPCSTRTPNKTLNNYVFIADSLGGVASMDCSKTYRFRPAFTLPSNAKVDADTQVLKGVA